MEPQKELTIDKNFMRQMMCYDIFCGPHTNALKNTERDSYRGY